jgi:Ca2+-binding EF-hand superfamily protein
MNTGMRISSEQEQRLFQLISISGTAAFSYSDFIVFVCDPNNSDVIWKLRKSIAQSKISENEIIDALNYQDQNSSGYVTSKQFAKAMKSCDVNLSDTDVSRITMRFDHDEVQRINTDMFIKLIRGQPYQSKVNTEVDNRLTNKSLDGVETQAWGVLKGRVEELIDTGYTNRYIDSLNYAFGWCAFMCRIRLCDTLSL